MVTKPARIRYESFVRALEERVASLRNSGIAANMVTESSLLGRANVFESSLKNGEV